MLEMCNFSFYPKSGNEIVSLFFLLLLLLHLFGYYSRALPIICGLGAYLKKRQRIKFNRNEIVEKMTVQNLSRARVASILKYIRFVLFLCHLRCCFRAQMLAAPFV